MMATLRRFRLLALIALFASPGVGGAAVQLLHQCPVADAALGAGPAHHGGEGAGHHGSAPASPAGTHEQCHCIGECSPAAVAVAPASGSAVAIAIVAFAVTPPASRDGVPAFAPSRFLPPATAPPGLVLALPS
jgi:hypothetical protein